MSWDIIGHEWAVDMLTRHIARGEVRHAYIFCGPPGVGRRTLALRFAQALNCPQPPAPGIPCRTCRSCRHIEEMAHPDLIVLEKPADKTEFPIDQVRALQSKLYLSPYESAYKVGLLLKFHQASDQAQNSLLKILEEAPSKVVLLLTSDTPEAVLPTVLSRCEVLRLRPLPAHDLAAALAQKKPGADPDRYQQSARVAAGCPGFALAMVQDSKTHERRQELLGTGLDLFSMSRRERLMMANDLFAKSRDNNTNREAMRLALRVWAALWRDILLCAGGAANPDEGPGWEVKTPMVNVDHADLIFDVASEVGLEQARRQLERLETVLEKLGPPYHTNPRLLGEVLLLDWPVV